MNSDNCNIFALYRKLSFELWTIFILYSPAGWHKLLQADKRLLRTNKIYEDQVVSQGVLIRSEDVLILSPQSSVLSPQFPVLNPQSLVLREDSLITTDF